MTWHVPMPKPGDDIRAELAALRAEFEALRGDTLQIVSRDYAARIADHLMAALEPVLGGLSPIPGATGGGDA